MNALPAIIITLPILFPITVKAGIDPILLGVIIVVLADLGQVTPPIGMNVFAMSAIARDIPMYGIFRAIIPFWAAFLVFIVILIMFPQISLFLPSLMMGN
jgi:TRAP-type C4-dicarboxylate transport system permease large subunit